MYLIGGFVTAFILFLVSSMFASDEYRSYSKELYEKNWFIIISLRIIAFALIIISTIVLIIQIVKSA